MENDSNKQNKIRTREQRIFSLKESNELVIERTRYYGEHAFDDNIIAHPALANLNLPPVILCFKF